MRIHLKNNIQCELDVRTSNQQVYTATILLLNNNNKIINAINNSTYKIQLKIVCFIFYI